MTTIIVNSLHSDRIPWRIYSSTHNILSFYEEYTRQQTTFFNFLWWIYLSIHKTLLLFYDKYTRHGKVAEFYVLSSILVIGKYQNFLGWAAKFCRYWYDQYTRVHTKFCHFYMTTILANLQNPVTSPCRVYWSTQKFYHFSMSSILDKHQNLQLFHVEYTRQHTKLCHFFMAIILANIKKFATFFDEYTRQLTKFGYY